MPIKSENGVKVGETLTVRLVKGLISENKPQDVFFKTYSVAVTSIDEVEDVVDRNAEVIQVKLEGYQERGSNWRVLGLEKHEINITKCKPLKGSSFIDTPPSIKYSRNSLLNTHNEDDKCLLWRHVRHLNPYKRNAQWVRVADEDSQRHSTMRA
ncbi:Hypothetical predicted protein [Paramuricea clavata]|uniref:Uncharacterized protein n=1 Tax=Paramuricea clavata TaxID=317549 RepID=A0A7D9EVZ0_PARCT|nr:Hypothetical predicted protein [Paramuricea clavata]